MAQKLFTGKNNDTGMVIEKKSSCQGNLDLSIKPVLMKDIKVGDVIAVNGASLKILSVNETANVFSVTIPKEILLNSTSFQAVQSGSYVTLQKPEAAGTLKGCPDGPCFWKSAMVYEDVIFACVEAKKELLDKIKADTLVALNGEVYHVALVTSAKGCFYVDYPPANAKAIAALPGRALPAHLQQVGAGAKEGKDNQMTPMNAEINVGLP